MSNAGSTSEMSGGPRGRRRPSTRARLGAVIVGAAATCTLGQQGRATTPWKSFQSKEYHAYLAAVSSELSGTPTQLKRKFPQIVSVAIALEKTNGWEGARGKEARRLLSKSRDALRWFEALRLLLSGDANGLGLLFGDDSRAPKKATEKPASAGSAPRPKPAHGDSGPASGKECGGRDGRRVDRTKFAGASCIHR